MNKSPKSPTVLSFPKSKSRFKILISVLAVGMTLSLGYFLHSHEEFQVFLHSLDKMGIWGPIIFIGLYVLLSGIFLPSIVFKVLSGVLFGIFFGLIWSSIAATLSSTLKFILARYVFRDAVQSKVQKNPLSQRVNSLIEKEGWKIILLLRNIPVVSSMFLNYICGLSSMRAWDFIWSSFVGRLPTTFLYACLGALTSYSTAMNAGSESRLTLDRILLGVTIVSCLGLSIMQPLFQKEYLTSP